MDVETRQLRALLAQATPNQATHNQATQNQAQHIPQVLLLKQSTTSTNDDVRELAQRGIDSILVCSETQTQGRGQRQRHWASPAGNIYLSTLVETKTALDGRLALEVALNILQIAALKSLNQLQIKWPNDLYSAQGKWGGILVEPLNTRQAIVGVGINLMPFSAAQISQQQIDQPATSLSQLGLERFDRIELISQLYLAIQQAGRWFDHGSYNLAGRFNHYAAFMDQAVEFEQIHQTIHGVFKGICDDGSVNIADEHGVQAYYQGRLRLQANHAEAQTDQDSGATS